MKVRQRDKGRAARVLIVLIFGVLIAANPTLVNAVSAVEVNSPVIGAIIVEYREGASPLTANGRPRGLACVTAVPRVSMRPGKDLGKRIYTVLFETPVPEALAEQVAVEFACNKAVVFAQPDRRVSIL